METASQIESIDTLSTHRDLNNPLIVPIPIERVCVRLFLSTHGDSGPTELLNGDKGFLEVRVFGQHVGTKVEGKVFRDQNMVRHFSKV